MYFCQRLHNDGANGKKTSEGIENFQVLDLIDVFRVFRPTIEFTFF